jgi:hypothetical protein
MSTDPHAPDDSVRLAYRDAVQAQPRIEPAPQLDARILQAAHAALQTPARKPARWSWLLLPLSATALAILVSTVVLQSRQAPRPPEPDNVAANAARPAAKAEIARSAAPKKNEPARKQDQALQLAAAEQAQAQRRREAATATAAEAAATQAKQERDLKIAAAEPPPTRRIEPAPSGAKPMADAAPTQVAAAPAAPPAERVTAAPAPGALEQKFEAMGHLAKSRGTAQPTEKQLEDIRKLQREGKREAAKKALAELRKQFPLYKVPEDLRALIEPAAPEENQAQPERAR